MSQTQTTTDDGLAASDGLLSLLGDMTAIFNDGDRLAVSWSAKNAAAIDPRGRVQLPVSQARRFDGVDLSPENELRLQLNSDSHETEHYRQTDLNAKRQSVIATGDRFAGHVQNLVEDAHIDATRTERFPGLRAAQALFVDAMMQSNDTDLSKLDDAEAMAAGLIQVSKAGYADGFGDCSDTVQRFLAKCDRVFRAVEARARDRDVDGSSAAEQRWRLEQAMQIREWYRQDVPQVTPDLEQFLQNLLDMLADSDFVDDDTGGYAVDLDTDTPDDMLPDDADADADADASGDGDGDGDVSGDGDADLDADEWDDAADADGDADDLDDAVADLADRSENADVADTWDAPSDYQNPSDHDLRRFQDVVDRNERPTIDIDAMTPDTMRSQTKASTEGVRKSFDESLADDIAAAFRPFKSAPSPTPADDGDRLDMRNYVARRAGNRGITDVFEHQRRTETGDRTIVVSADASTSMDEMALKTGIAAVAEATRIIGDEFLAAVWSTRRRAIVTGPGETFDWNHLNAATTGGNTPTPAGLDDAAALLDHAARSERVLIVITDGKANTTVPGESGDATTQAARRVADLRADGVTVIGLAVGGGVTTDDMDTMFGGAWVRTDDANLPDTLADLYRSQLKVQV